MKEKEGRQGDKNPNMDEYDIYIVEATGKESS